MRYENDDDMSSDTVGELIDDSVFAEYWVQPSLEKFIVGELELSNSSYMRSITCCVVFCTEFDIMFGAPKYYILAQRL